MQRKDFTMNKTIRICGAEWDLLFDKNINGGSFTCYGDNGRGDITIGTQWKDKTYQLRTLIHEIIEAILTQGLKRYRAHNDAEGSLKIFLFDHDYLSEVLPDALMDAMKSAGVKMEWKK